MTRATQLSQELVSRNTHLSQELVGRNSRVFSSIYVWVLFHIFYFGHHGSQTVISRISFVELFQHHPLHPDAETSSEKTYRQPTGCVGTCSPSLTSLHHQELRIEMAIKQSHTREMGTHLRSNHNQMSIAQLVQPFGKTT